MTIDAWSTAKGPAHQRWTALASGTLYAIHAGGGNTGGAGEAGNLLHGMAVSIECNFIHLTEGADQGRQRVIYFLHGGGGQVRGDNYGCRKRKRVSCKELELLHHAIFVNLEIVGSKPGDQFAGGVLDSNGDLHEVNGNAHFIQVITATWHAALSQRCALFLRSRSRRSFGLVRMCIDRSGRSIPRELALLL